MNKIQIHLCFTGLFIQCMNVLYSFHFILSMCVLPLFPPAETQYLLLSTMKINKTLEVNVSTASQVQNCIYLCLVVLIILFEYQSLLLVSHRLCHANKSPCFPQPGLRRSCDQIQKNLRRVQRGLLIRNGERIQMQKEKTTRVEGESSFRQRPTTLLHIWHI